MGLVLSGGGARASFQLGALTYLYDRVGIAPQVITGTSAGSILAGVLAQSGTAAGQREGLARLERVWRDMRRSSDMFEELEWFATLREHGPGWIETFTRRRQRQDALGRTFARVANRSTHRLGLRTARAEVAESVADAAATAHRTGLDLFGRAEPDSADGGWNPLSAIELFTVLRDAGRARPELETILRGAVRERSMYRPGPVVDRLLDPAVFVPGRVPASGVTLRIAVVGLESGELRYVTEAGAMVDREDVPVPGAPIVPLARAILASCSIPTVFAPVALGEEYYVDGGVRETLPTEVAIEHLGVDRCYAVVASPPGLAREESFADKDMLSIVVRTAAGIMADEGLRDEVAYARAAGAVVIQPDIDVHDVLTVDPGLVSIAIDYGYVRAAEAHQGASDVEEQLTRDIVLLRKQIWAAEDALLRPAPVSGDGVRPAAGDAAGGGAGPGGTPPDPQGLADLADLKRRLRALVNQAPADRLPPGAGEWWRGWEGHPWPVPIAPDWARNDR